MRNENGEVLACACYKKPPVLDSALAKTVALWHAIELYNDLGFNGVVLEGDTQVVVKAVNSENKDLSSSGHIVEDIKAILKGRNAWKVQCRRRE